MAAIDIGAGAINRDAARTLANYTSIDTFNPANDTGTLTSFEIWANAEMANVKMGTFEDDGSNFYTNRDYETLGTVAAGSKQTFSELDCDVVTGDVIGVIWTAGELDQTNFGGVQCYHYDGDAFGGGSVQYLAQGALKWSLYGIGSTPAPPPPPTKPYTPHCGPRKKRVDFFPTLKLGG